MTFNFDLMRQMGSRRGSGSVEARLSEALGQEGSRTGTWEVRGSRRLSRSLEDLPTDIQDHILRCQCSCDHLGYGNFSVSTPFKVFRDITNASFNVFYVMLICS